MGELGTQVDHAERLSDDNVSQMLQLAERLRAANGGELDDAAIQAVAEATNTPAEYVRLAARMMPERNQSSVEQVRSAFMEIEPDTRRHVASALCATIAALALVAADRNAASTAKDFFHTIMLIMIGVGCWNLSLSRDSRLAIMCGALFGGIFFFAESLFAYVFRGTSIASPLLIVFILGGAALGAIMHGFVKKFRKKLGMVDPVRERQDLLRQLVTLQDKLKSGEQHITIVSVDLVGSTQLKSGADPLSVEFTFTEYHQFVEQTAKRFQGRIHSTAGDGVTLAFDHAHQAFAASKFLQTAILEFNTFRNKLGTPLVMRVGIHSGSVVTPKAGDITSLNFAHVIDMAAHIQKVCPPGGISVSDAAATQIPGGAAAIGAEKAMVMETGATIWMPRTALTMAASELTS